MASKLNCNTTLFIFETKHDNFGVGHKQLDHEF